MAGKIPSGSACGKRRRPIWAFGRPSGIARLRAGALESVMISL